MEQRTFLSFHFLKPGSTNGGQGEILRVLNTDCPSYWTQASALEENTIVLKTWT